MSLINGMISSLQNPIIKASLFGLAGMLFCNRLDLSKAIAIGTALAAIAALGSIFREERPHMEASSHIQSDPSSAVPQIISPPPEVASSEHKQPTVPSHAPLQALSIKKSVVPISVNSPSPLWEGPALVIGVWRPGIPGKVVTLALDYSDEGSRTSHIFNRNFRPDFEGDLMAIPSEQIGRGKYGRIIFQGCCPVSTAMGAIPCSANEDYSKLDVRPLAFKLRELISERGAFIFCRHCIDSAHPRGIKDPKQREAFISEMGKVGFQLMPQKLHAPYRLTQYSPSSEIPDPHPDVKDKWEFANGGLIFFAPP